jgi:hypothetical protein
MNMKLNTGLAALSLTMLTAGALFAQPLELDRNTDIITRQRLQNAQTGLLGIRLFDSGVRVVSLYGAPDRVEAISVPGGTAAGAGGDQGNQGAQGGPGGPGGPQPEGFGRQITETIRQTAGSGALPPPPMPGDAGSGTGGGAGGDAGGAGGGDTTSARTTFTRWVYLRNNMQFAFSIDRFNRVIQIEAIALRNPQVRTRKGITFGSTFAAIQKAYGAPDGYDIQGERFTVKYLVYDRVAFTLTRIQPNRPQVVTAIVVAAGKQ